MNEEMFKHRTFWADSLADWAALPAESIKLLAFSCIKQTYGKITII
jgi:hypothetical protein